MKCPAGHDIPHNGRHGQCSPLFCGDTENDSSLAVVDANTGMDPTKGSDAEERAIELALTREKIRRRVLRPPSNLDEAQADEYTSGKLAKLTVEAVMELEWNLRFGDATQRAKAAEKILAATGHGPKEGGASVGALIVIQANGAQATVPPWKRKKPEVVDATAVEVESEDKGD